MGLDMYLTRMPRYNGATADDIRAVESFIDWIDAIIKGSEYATCTFERWCGRKEIPSQEFIEFYAPLYTKKYSYNDVDKKYGFFRIDEEVGYWRKANAVHNWFVKNVQDGVDDCEYHRKVTKEDLEELRDVCYKVLSDPNLAEELLPTQCGFFFGPIEYDEWYERSLMDTIAIIDGVLKTTDFKTQMIYYRSSW